MADITIPEHCEFEIPVADQIKLTTQTNGDRIEIHGIHLGSEQAAALAYLLNKSVSLTVEIKEK